MPQNADPAARFHGQASLGDDSGTGVGLEVNWGWRTIAGIFAGPGLT